MCSLSQVLQLLEQSRHRFPIAMRSASDTKFAVLAFVTAAASSAAPLRLGSGISRDWVSRRTLEGVGNLISFR